VEDALRRGIVLLGGRERFVQAGERILLKPNILAAEPPERAVTTHPAVLEASARLFKDAGATVSFGDSPGFENAVHAARGSGLIEAGARCGATLADFATGRPMSGPGGAGRAGRRFPIARAVHECDGLINLPKMKSHRLTRITGAVKNLYGCIPGKRKALYHVQHRNVPEFCELVAELALLLQARLHILDGIVAMEGNGPRGGDPREVGVLVLSADPVAVDATFCRIVDMDPEMVPTIVAGQRQGVGVYDETQIAYVGERPEAVRVPGFRMVRKPVYDNASYAHYPPIKNVLLPRPVIDGDRCTRCGMCVEACPVPGKAVRFAGGQAGMPPTYDYDVCIRCCCCLEACPHRAIDTRTPVLGRILGFG
jgi:uncharacterized protein (DUF362 family)/NAD-dependent dihydropyrimidine dehydrogenase PreA subunit